MPTTKTVYDPIPVSENTSIWKASFKAYKKEYEVIGYATPISVESWKGGVEIRTAKRKALKYSATFLPVKYDDDMENTVFRMMETGMIYCFKWSNINLDDNRAAPRYFSRMGAVWDAVKTFKKER